jgi:hypothetical protein
MILFTWMLTVSFNLQLRGFLTIIFGLILTIANPGACLPVYPTLAGRQGFGRS